MWSGRCQTVRAPKATEAGTEGWRAWLRGGQTQASVVTTVDAAGRDSVAAGRAFKTLWWREERARTQKNLAAFFPEANWDNAAQRVPDSYIKGPPRAPSQLCGRCSVCPC